MVTVATTKKRRTRIRWGGVIKRMHGWGVNSGYNHVTSQLYSSKGGIYKKRHGGGGGSAQPLAPAAKLAQWRQRGSVTWDVTLSRPIQHCEGHNRQGVGLSHTGCRSLCRTTDNCASPCRATGYTHTNTHTHCGLYRGLAGESGGLGSLLFHVHTVLHFMNINFMFT